MQTDEQRRQELEQDARRPTLFHLLSVLFFVFLTPISHYKFSRLALADPFRIPAQKRVPVQNQLFSGPKWLLPEKRAVAESGRRSVGSGSAFITRLERNNLTFKIKAVGLESEVPTTTLPYGGGAARIADAPCFPQYTASLRLVLLA